ncbi:Hypothetical protein, putative [Bodo saltans]|uniref:Uncharacterized protein n=1 Tax=Bodo saltans TaxID=75058 RepID=A0A0S4J612_BODSA|nr:Hypothetical protein, putative [Bodo saltans]|eukprot:CUG86880.1 Hypothetical protein, putative [Bodo saltans]
MAKPNQDNSYKHWMLGLPAEGPKMGSPEAETLHSAEAFLDNIRAEIDDFDRVNAEAMKGRLSSWKFWKSAPSPMEVGATSSVAAAVAAEVASSQGSGIERTSASSPQSGMRRSTAPLTKSQQLAAFMRRKRNVDRVPILQRWWIPWCCFGALCIVWTPDTWKLRGLHFADSNYAALRRWIHTEYWRATMSSDDFATLMKEMEAARPRSVKSTDCPF